VSNLKRPDGLKVLHELIAFEWRAHRAVWLSLIALIFGVSILFGIWTASAENWIVSVLSYALLAGILLGALAILALELVRLTLKRALNTPRDSALTRVRLYQIGIGALMVVLFLVRLFLQTMNL
jgi:hypothetical protein